MKRCTLLILFLTVGLPSAMQAQYAYFYTGGGRGAELNELSIVLQTDEGSTRFGMVYDWIRIDLQKGMNELTVQSTVLDGDKNLKADLTSSDAVFYSIELQDDAWKIVPETYEEAHSSARSDYDLQKDKVRQKERMKTHPTTKWTIESIKEKFDGSNDPLEGIYRNSDTYSYGDTSTYTLGVIKKDVGYDIVYLSGGSEAVWKEGDLKGTMEKTGKKDVYDTNWYMSDKSLEKGGYAYFKDNTLSVDVTDRISIYYIKSYPKVK